MAYRLLVDFGGNADASGRATVIMPQATQWCEVTLSAQLGSSPNAAWTVGIYRGQLLLHKLGFGVGATVVSGPFVIAPGEALGASITGAAANDSVTCTAYGTQDVDPANLDTRSVFGSVTTTQITGGITGAVTTTTPQQIVGTASTASVNPSVTNFPLPSGTQAVLLRTYSGGFPHLVHVKVVGHTDLISYFETYYFQRTPPSDGWIVVFPIDSASNSSVDVTLQTDALGSAAVGITALLESVPEFLEYYQPPWIAPNQSPFTVGILPPPAVGPFAVISPIANVYATLFRLTSIDADGIPANSSAGVQLSYATSAAGPFTTVGKITFNNTLAVAGGGLLPDFVPGPVTLPAGNGLYGSWLGSGTGGVSSISVSPVFSRS